MSSVRQVRAACGLDDGALKGAAQQQRIALPHQAGGDARQVLLITQNVVDVGTDRQAIVKDQLGGGPRQSARGTAGTQTRPAWGRFP